MNANLTVRLRSLQNNLECLEKKIEAGAYSLAFTSGLVLLGLSVGSVLLARPSAPGVAVALMGAIAAIVSLRPAMRPTEKFVWYVAFAILLFAEIRAIRRDKAGVEAQSLKDRQIQQTRFSAVLQKQDAEFSSAIKGFRDQSDATRALAQTTRNIATTATRSLAAVTGGNSYAIVEPVVWTGGTEIPLFVVNRGTNILSGVTVLITTEFVFMRGTQDEILRGFNQRVMVGTLAPNESFGLPQSLHMDRADPNRSPEMPTVFITITAQNYSVSEYLYVRKRAKQPYTNNPLYEYKINAYRYATKAELTRNPKLTEILLEKSEWGEDWKR